MLDKDAIRRNVWGLMEEFGVARFPRPIAGRIPNFEGSERAAQKLISQGEFQSARVVKVNPDSPQIHVRRSVLLSGKSLIMPSPRLRITCWQYFMMKVIQRLQIMNLRLILI